ncbi:MAG TPA: hypothetical protein VFC95_05500 [Guyparkeria sp.]|nr:hypothetical protein [Guyparkeria sp.]
MNTIVSIALAAILATESSGYKPENVPVRDGGRAVGMYQMWPCAVVEANRIVGRELWTLDDRWNPQLSRAMCKVTLEWHYKRGVTDPVELACRWRNPQGNAPEWHKAKIRKAVTKHTRRAGSRSPGNGEQ